VFSKAGDPTADDPQDTSLPVNRAASDLWNIPIYGTAVMTSVSDHEDAGRRHIVDLKRDDLLFFMEELDLGPRPADGSHRRLAMRDIL